MSDSSLKPVIIFGAKGLAKAAFEILKSNRVVVYGFLDDDESLKDTSIDEASVLGKMDDGGFLKLLGAKCDAFVALEDTQERKEIVALLNDRRKIMPMNVIAANASIAQTSSMGHGNFLNHQCSLGAFSELGNHCLIHTGVQIDYEVSIGDFVQIGSGSTIGAGVSIGEEVFIGSGAVIVPGVQVARGARIGAGSVVIKDVEEDSTVFGNPAQELEV
ncbi:MAG: acetyltransferase [Bacteroidota bacterium]